jgi:alpha-methylacyl-CoA racemase
MHAAPQHPPFRTGAAATLAGVTVVELAAIGPVPFATHLLQQLGADVTIIDSPKDRGLGLPIPPEHDYLAAGKRRMTLDLKSGQGREELFNLLANADVLVEGFRPGTLERLSLSMPALHAACPALIIGRCSGWGALSPRRHTAGHDINFLALSGALSAIGNGTPTPPLNLVGDYGGAGMHLVVGLLGALFRRQVDGLGAVVDTSIFQGTTSLMTMLYGLSDAGQWNDRQVSNTLDGGAPYYTCYETADGQWMALGAIEEKFFAEFVRKIQADIDISRQHDRAYWPVLRSKIDAMMRLRTQDEWDLLFCNTDCCCAPVLNFQTSRKHGDVMPLFDGAVPKAPIGFTIATQHD